MKTHMVSNINSFLDKSIDLNYAELAAYLLSCLYNFGSISIRCSSIIVHIYAVFYFFIINLMLCLSPQVSNNVNKLAIPRIGCGLDGLVWQKVKDLLQEVFKDTRIEIIVYNYMP